MTKVVPMLVLVVVLTVVGALYHFATLDGLPGLVLGSVLSDATEYAPGYSDAAFGAVQEGMSTDQVLALIGPPLGEVWMIKRRDSDGCLSVYFENDRVVHGCEARGLHPGMPRLEAGRRVVAEEVSWLYSRSPQDSHYKMRVVRLRGGSTTEIVSGWYLD